MGCRWSSRPGRCQADACPCAYAQHAGNGAGRNQGDRAGSSPLDCNHAACRGGNALAHTQHAGNGAGRYRGDRPIDYRHGRNINALAFTQHGKRSAAYGYPDQYAAAAAHANKYVFANKHAAAYSYTYKYAAAYGYANPGRRRNL